jgi:hypothetical protein
MRDAHCEPKLRENEAEELCEDMTVGDLVHALQHSSFSNGGVSLVSLDRPVRDYLVRCLRQR